jgi:hypothetical protein
VRLLGVPLWALLPYNVQQGGWGISGEFTLCGCWASASSGDTELLCVYAQDGLPRKHPPRRTRRSSQAYPLVTAGSKTGIQPRVALLHLMTRQVRAPTKPAL